jgi:methionyl-tRNA synthetase
MSTPHTYITTQVTEENWFFRLSRYAAPLRSAITSGRLRIEPAGRRNEVLAFIDSGLEDFSVSRPASRAGGWGIPVPGEPDQPTRGCAWRRCSARCSTRARPWAGN